MLHQQLHFRHAIVFIVIQAERYQCLLGQGIRIYEVPISFNAREWSEGKKIKWTDGPKALWALVKYRFVD